MVLYLSYLSGFSPLLKNVIIVIIACVAQLVRAPSLYLGGSWFKSKHTHILFVKKTDSSIIKKGIMKKILNKSINFIKKHKIKIIILLIIIAIIFWQLSKNQQDSSDQTFAHPEYQDLTQTLELTGSVDAKKKARLRFLAGGKIVYLGAQEGDWVKQWQTIATIDQRDLQKRLEKSLNSYMQQRWDWEDLQDDIKDEVLDTSERRYVDKEQWSLTNTVIDVEIQDISISQTVMSAPFAGVLVSAPVATAHTQVTAGDYFELIDPQSLIFRAEINEEDVPLVRVGQQATIALDAYPDQTINTQISYISFQSIQTSSGTSFLIELPINNQSGQDPLDSLSILNKYRLGMNGDVALVLEQKKNVLSIPLIALIQREDKSYVEILVDDDQIVEREIEIGLETDDFIEIVSGLTKDDLVLIPSVN